MSMNENGKKANGADLIVYGKIFTSENNRIAEAFAVKDGKYVYVGDKKGAEALIEDGRTEILDYTGKGLVMPSCGNGHAHYSMGYALQSVGTIVGGQDDADKFLKEILPAAVKKARDTGATTVFGFGWNYMLFKEHMSTCQQLDEICSDIPIYFADEEGHKDLVNTLCLIKAGIMKEDGTVLRKEVRGGEIVMGSDGTPTGFLKEQAGTFVRSFLDNDRLFTVDMSATGERLSRAKLGVPVFAMSRNDTYAVERFRRTPGAVLLATGAAWEGFDFPGDCVSMLISQTRCAVANIFFTQHKLRPTSTCVNLHKRGV